MPDGHFDVAEKRCDQCLFSSACIVSPERKAQVLADCERRDTHFICHKFTANGSEACCRAFYDEDPLRTNLMRIAARLGAVRFVPVPTIEVPGGDD